MAKSTAMVSSSKGKEKATMGNSYSFTDANPWLHKEFHLAKQVLLKEYVQADDMNIDMKKLAALFTGVMQVANSWKSAQYHDRTRCAVPKHPAAIQILDRVPKITIDDTARDVNPWARQLTADQIKSVGLQVDMLLGHKPQYECMQQIGTKYWRYYDYGPKSVPPLICLPGTAGTAEVFYKQILTLSSKGYRVIAADAPPVWSHQEWVNAFEKFLDTIGVHHVHIYGTSLGGFLAQLFAHYRPRRVQSLVLSNTFLDTREFAAATTWSSLITWTPEFMLKRYILSGIRDGPQEPLIVDSIDFVVSQLETLSKKELAARLTLNTTVVAIGQVFVPDSEITIMDA
ncbi:hypothetical protein L7F22_048864 [Adiantum nelumboides]|nr:hypothetical protein [Adiantum nelumboides]